MKIFRPERPAKKDYIMKPRNDKIYFYHSFQRPHLNKDNDSETNLLVLESISKIGLICTPRLISFKQRLPNGQLSDKIKIEKISVSVCLTAIPRRDISRHARKFGTFSIEFDQEIMDKLVICPAVYMPSPKDTPPNHTSDTMADLMIEMGNVETLLLQRYTVETGDVKNHIGKMIGANGWFWELLTSTSSRLKNEDLEYYRQREWRILRGVTSRTKEVNSRPLEEHEIDYILAQPKLAPYFSESVNYPPPLSEEFLSGVPAKARPRRIDWCEVLKKIDDKHVLEFANAIYVPKDVKTEAEAILKKYGLNNVKVKASP